MRVRFVVACSCVLLGSVGCGGGAGSGLASLPDGSSSAEVTGQDGTSSADGTTSDTASPGDAADASTDTAAPDVAADVGPAPDTTGGVCAPVTVPCTDEQISDLSLFKKASQRAITNQADGAGFISQIDATGGGMQPSESFVYARFTEKGLVRADVGDLAALESADWDIAFRRFVARVNSGSGGPSCVGVWPVGASTKYEDLLSVPSAAKFASEAYYDAACKLVEDDSGIGGPDTLLASFWKYANCVQMTGKVYLLRLADGRVVKLTFTSYYSPTAQAQCDSKGSIPTGSVGGDVHVRWAFVQP